MNLLQADFDWGHVWLGLGVVIPLGLQQFLIHRANRKAIEERDRKLTFVLGEYLPHKHNERGDGTPLMKGGISYPNVRINGESGRR
jgi:hypothetical protein